MSVQIGAERARRRRVRLTPTTSIPVGFTGERGGEGPLTAGQRNIHAWLGETPDHPFGNLWVEFPVPPMLSVDDVAGAVARLIARHEGLRTGVVPGTPPRQRFAASGVQMLDVCSLGEGQWGPGDRPAVADVLLRWLRDRGEPQWRPLRMAVAVAPDMDDRVIACAAGFAHLNVDHAAIEILKRDFAALLGHPGRELPGRPVHQPLEQAESEAAPAGRRRAEAALDYMREQSWRVPRCLYALPDARPGGESLAVELSSVSAALAVRQVAARTRASRSSSILAAVCAVIAHRTNYRDLVFPLVASNRFERHLMDYVGCLAQGSIATVQVREKGFDELVGHTWAAVLEASRHAGYDGFERSVFNDVAERQRGLRFNHDPFFNSLVPESWSGLTAGVAFRPEQVDAALSRTRLGWRPMPETGGPIRFTLNQIDDCLRLEAWSADTGLLPRAELESVLLAVERVLVAAAHGDVPHALMPELIGLEPFAGSSDRILVDSSWIDVADVQRLVEQAVPTAVVQVFASAAGHALVACLTATDAVRTPEEAHARCMAVLADHPTAVTPRHYVICDAAPSNPADPAAWPVPSAGGLTSGRLTP